MRKAWILITAASVAATGFGMGCDHDRHERDETHVRSVTVVPDAGRYPSGSPSVSYPGVPATPPVVVTPAPATVTEPTPAVIVAPAGPNVVTSGTVVVPADPTVVVSPPRESVPGSHDNTGSGTIAPNSTGVPGSGTGIGSGGGTGTGATTAGGPDIGGRDRPTDGIVHRQD
jgi:hypothetical protein